MASIELKCCFCNASFHPGVLNELGKCPTCELNYPSVKTLKEAMAMNQPEFHMGEELTVDKIREIVREELAKNRCDSEELKTIMPDKSALSEHAETIVKKAVKSDNNKETK